MNNTFISKLKVNFNLEAAEQQPKLVKCKRCGTRFQSTDTSCPHCRKEGYNIYITEEVKPPKSAKSMFTRLFSL